MANQSQRAEYIHRWQRAGARRSPASERDVGVMVLSWVARGRRHHGQHPILLASFFLLPWMMIIVHVQLSCVGRSVSA